MKGFCRAERRSARASATGPYASGCGHAARRYISPSAARATLPRIVIGTNDPINEGVQREDARDAISKEAVRE